MQKCHYGHRQEVKGALDGMGEHFHSHAVKQQVDINNEFEKVMGWCRITIVASVQPGKPWTKNS